MSERRIAARDAQADVLSEEVKQLKTNQKHASHARDATRIEKYIASKEAEIRALRSPLPAGADVGAVSDVGAPSSPPEHKVHEVAVSIGQSLTNMLHQMPGLGA